MDIDAHRAGVEYKVIVNISCISESPRAIGIILKRAASESGLFLFNLNGIRVARRPNVRLLWNTHGTGESD